MAIGRVAFLMIVTIAVGSLNNLLSQVRSVPLKQYNYLAAILNNVVYVAFWGITVFFGIRHGYTDMSHVRFVFDRKRGAWRFLALAGLGDSIGQVLAFIGQPHLTLPLFSMAMQSGIFFTAIASTALLRARYIFLELLAIAIVVTGVSVYVASLEDDRDSRVEFMVVVAFSTAGYSLSVTIKQLVFEKFRERGGAEFIHEMEMAGSPIQSPIESCHSSGSRQRGLTVCEVTGSHVGGGSHSEVNIIQCKNLQVFVVSLCTCSFGLLFSLLMLPLNALFKQTGDKTLAEFFVDGLTCLSNSLPERDIGLPNGAYSCVFAWQTYAIYVGVNLAFNVIVLMMVTYGSAVLLSLSLKAVTPGSMVMSLVPWHVGPITLKAAHVTSAGWVSLIMVLLGVVLFRRGNVLKETLPSDSRKCCWPICGYG